MLPTGQPFHTVEIEVAAGDVDVDELIDLLVVADAPPTRDGSVEVDLDGPGGAIDLHVDAATTISGTITADDELASVDVWQSYSSPRDIGRERVRRVGPAQWVVQPDGSVRVWADGRLVAGDGHVGIHARTVSGAMAVASQPVSVQRPTGRPGTVAEGAEPAGDSDTDVRIAAVEVTQGMRASVLTVPEGEPGVRLADEQLLLAGRTTLVRVLPTAAADVEAVTARLIGVRDGVPLPGGPLEPLWAGTTVSPAEDLDRLRAGVDGVLTFRLPDEWTRDAGSLTLAVQLDPPGLDTRQTCEDCRAGDLLHVDLDLTAVDEPLTLWPRGRAGVTREVVAEVVASLGRWLPLPADAIELVRPVTAPVGAEDPSAWVVHDLLTDVAAGRDVVQLWLDAPGECQARALIGAGVAAAGACSHVPAHALAHVFGQPHAEDPHTTGAGCGNAVGVDVTADPPRVIDPRASWGNDQVTLADDLEGCDGGHAHDLMSSGGRTVLATPPTWDELARVLSDDASRSLLTPADSDGDTEVFVLSGEQATRVVVAGSHRLAGADALAEVDGETVEAHRFRDEAGGTAWVVALPAGKWDRLAVGGETVERGDDLDVTVDAPASGEAISGDLEVAWSVSGGEGRAVIEVADADGAWWPVAVTDGTSVTLGDLPVGGPVQVRVQVSDGARHGTSEAVEIATPPRTPDLLITSPTHGEHAATGRGIELVGKVAGEVDDDDLVWEVGGSEVARGPRALLTGLAAGEHEVVLRAVDRSAEGARVRASVVVQADADGDGIPDPWEVANGLDPLDPRDMLLDRDGDGASAIDEFHIGADPSRVDSDDDGAWDGVELAAGTAPSDPDATPASIHTWPDPLPQPVAVTGGDDAGWWGEWWTSSRALLAAAVVLVFGIDAWLLVRRRRRRRYG